MPGTGPPVSIHPWAHRKSIDSRERQVEANRSRRCRSRRYRSGHDDAGRGARDAGSSAGQARQGDENGRGVLEIGRIRGKNQIRWPGDQARDRFAWREHAMLGIRHESRHRPGLIGKVGDRQPQLTRQFASSRVAQGLFEQNCGASELGFPRGSSAPGP